MDFSESPTDPPEGGGLDLGLFSKSNRPSRRGGLDIGLSKRANPNRRGGVVQSDVRITTVRTRLALSLKRPVEISC